MKLFFIFFICIFCANNSSYSQWFVVFENDKSVRDILFIDRIKGFAISSDKLISTIDSGKTWTSVLYNGIDDGLFNDIVFPSYDTGYIVADGSEGPLYTHDAGETWQYQITLPFTDMNATCVSMINNDIGYTGTDASSYRFTTDGFATEIGGGVSSSGDYFKSIHFLDLDTGYAGTLFHLYKTTNAGLDWSIISIDNLGISQILFISPQVGYYIDDFGLYNTHDFGKHWDSIPIPISSSGNPKCFTILGTDTIFIGGEHNGKPFILRSFDAGETWTDTEIGDEISVGIYPSVVTDIYCFDANHCFATIGPFGFILKTTNGGGIAGVHNEIQNIYFSISPNPSSSFISLSFQNNPDSYRNEIKIITTNYLGEKLNILFDENYHADISALPSGIYITEIITDKNKGMQKWVKL